MSEETDTLTLHDAEQNEPDENLPSGAPGDDWLELDDRASSSKSSALGRMVGTSGDFLRALLQGARERLRR